jgi:chemotaxis methyl-accepting protein methylase
MLATVFSSPPVAPDIDRADYRHIVFADMLPAGRAINFAPDAPRSTICFGRRPAVTHLTEEQASFVRDLFRISGLDAADYRNETILRRLPACLRALHVETVREAAQAVQRQPRLAATALEAILIGVTSFFRDRAIFEDLAERIAGLPARRGAVKHDAPLRVWSAGCSDGQELYSLAILLHQRGLLGDDLAGAELLGTDCRAPATRRASAGVYDADTVRALPAALLQNYFAPQRDGLWRVRLPLRTRLRWRTADVLVMDEPGAWDVILCRNVAMYLRPDSAARLFERLHRLLRPGGLLVLGKAERPTGSAAGLACVSSCIYRRDRG